jgi:hypothetical protein
MSLYTSEKVDKVSGFFMRLNCKCGEVYWTKTSRFDELRKEQAPLYCIRGHLIITDMIKQPEDETFKAQMELAKRLAGDVGDQLRAIVSTAERRAVKREAEGFKTLQRIIKKPKPRGLPRAKRRKKR